PAYTWKAQGIRNSYWQEISFGDGFDVLPDPTDSRYGISTSQQGFAGIYDRVSGYFETIRPTNPDSNIELRFNWNAGINRDPSDPKIIYFGSQFLHKSLDGGQTWSIISPDLTTNDPAKQKQGDSGGLTLDATGAENHCTILVIEPSPLEPNVLWVGTDDGNVQLTRNGGQSWTNVQPNITGLPKGAWINQIKASNKNKGEALLVANDYRRFNYTPYAFRTRDYGKTWERIVDQQDVASYALCIVEDPLEANLMFLGTDDGMYISIDGAKNWTKWTQGLPTTNVMDLVIHPRDHDLVIGTFGRAAYVLDDIRPLREIATTSGSALKQKLSVYPPPVAYLAATQQPTGSRFGADAMFNAENRSTNALISYSISVPEKEPAKEETATAGKKKNTSPASAVKPGENKKVNYDTVMLEVLTSSGDIIRTIRQKAPDKSGIYRMEWGMDEKGVNRITRTGQNKPGNESGGVNVLPGTYNIRITYGDQRDSSEIEVKYDPRISISPLELKAQYEALKNLEAQAEKGLKAVEQVKQSLRIASEFESKLKDKDKEAFKSQLELIKATKDTLNTLLDLFFGKEDERQGITRNQSQNIMSHYFTAYRYTSNALHAPTETEQKLTEKFTTELNKSLQLINGYFDTKWPEFRTAMEAISLSPFRDVEKIE
ncbi:MAG: hypothetical protein OEY56_11350, partial [Cyclobacteriaceae bacterium]|nr:hypothetical protein [Cyclobacteriaceae bacterium]